MLYSNIYDQLLITYDISRSNYALVMLEQEAAVFYWKGFVHNVPYYTAHCWCW